MDLILEWNLNPEIKLLGGVAVRYYSILFGAGLLIELSVAKRLWNHKGFSDEAFDRLTIYVFLAIVFGSRIGHCLFYEPDYYLSRPLEMILPIHFEDGGISFSGFRGLASHGGILAVYQNMIPFRNHRSFGSLRLLLPWRSQRFFRRIPWSLLDLQVYRRF